MYVHFPYQLLRIAKLNLAFVDDPHKLADREQYSPLIIHIVKYLSSAVSMTGSFSVGVCPDAVNKEIPKKYDNHGQG